MRYSLAKHYEIGHPGTSIPHLLMVGVETRVIAERRGPSGAAMPIAQPIHFCKYQTHFANTRQLVQQCQ